VKACAPIPVFEHGATIEAPRLRVQMAVQST